MELSKAISESQEDEQYPLVRNGTEVLDETMQEPKSGMIAGSKGDILKTDNSDNILPYAEVQQYQTIIEKGDSRVQENEGAGLIFKNSGVANSNPSFK